MVPVIPAPETEISAPAEVKTGADCNRRKLRANKLKSVDRSMMLQLSPEERERQRTEEERLAKEQERQRAERLEELLRVQGIDPDQLLDV